MKNNMNLRKLIAVLLSYLGCIFFAILFFILLFHVEFLKFTNVFFYYGIVFLFLSAIICSILMLLIKSLSKNFVTIRDVITVFFFIFRFHTWLACSHSCNCRAFYFSIHAKLFRTKR